MEKKAANKTTSTKESKNDIDGLTIGLQFADTSWRVAVPIVALTFIGIKLDQHYGTRPWLSISGLFISIAVATLLVYKQLKAAYPDFMGKGGKK